MPESIIENDQIHLLGLILFVVVLKSPVASLSDSIQVWASFINEWSLLFNITRFIKDVISLEISEKIVLNQLLVFKTKARCITELVFGDSIQQITKDFLVVEVSQLVNKGSVGLMSPKNDHQLFRRDLLFDITAVLDNFVLRLLNDSANTTEDTCKITNIEVIVELGWGWKKSLSCGIPNGNGCINDEWSHVDDVGTIFLWIE